jgi:ribosomal protein L33
MLLKKSNPISCISCTRRVIVTRLMSAAGTGYFYTIKKPRIRDRMTLRKYDPVGTTLGVD